MNNYLYCEDGRTLADDLTPLAVHLLLHLVHLQVELDALRLENIII